MSEHAASALLLPIKKGFVANPSAAFLIRAIAAPAFDLHWRRILICEQTFKPEYDRLIQSGFHVIPKLDGRHAFGFCLLNKHKDENLANVSRGWSLLDDGGVLVCAGATNEGATSIEKLVDAALGLEGRDVKYRCRVFWIQKSEKRPPPPEWIQLGQLRPVDGTAYVARAGTFSSSKIDFGSAVLARHLPEDISGKVGDLGAGWGYLGAELLKRFPLVTDLHVYEAEALALEAARINLSGHSLANVEFYWSDVTRGLSGYPRYDWLVTNPPFHRGRQADLALPRAFIRAASEGLHKGGVLLMVANQHLSYESLLQREFSGYRELARENGFKVLRAQR